MDLPNHLERTAICDGKVICVQPRDGFRFSVDALLLALFALEGAVSRERFCELGAGCGVIAAILSRRPGVTGAVVERDPVMVECLAATLRENGLNGRIDLLGSDLRALRERVPAGSFMSVVSNPPYFAVGRGRVDPALPQAGARHELAGTMADFLSAARYVLRPRGRLHLIYPAVRLGECLQLLPAHKLQPTRLQLVHQRVNRRASHFLLEAAKSSGPELVVEAPRVVHSDAAHGYGEWYGALLRHMEE
jgi:tRNA1Val (adenine37-N6)-methyltransferase